MTGLVLLPLCLPLLVGFAGAAPDAVVEVCAVGFCMVSPLLSDPLPVLAAFALLLLPSPGCCAPALFAFVIMIPSSVSSTFALDLFGFDGMLPPAEGGGNQVLSPPPVWD